MLLNKLFIKKILIIDGVENIIPQCTKYRVTHKAEQLTKMGYKVDIQNASTLQNIKINNYVKLIIYRCHDLSNIVQLVVNAKKYNVPTYYDIDDLVMDTKYTDMLEYTHSISKEEKEAYDNGVKSYGRMLTYCDYAIASTSGMQDALSQYKPTILNRNVLSDYDLKLCKDAIMGGTKHQDIRIAFFSGSITHNENFEMIKEDIIKILRNYENTSLYLVGHIDLPKELETFKDRIDIKPYMSSELLPKLIADVDINLAPLVDNTFNRAKSAIKWLEASSCNTVTIASNIGSFKDMIIDNKTGILSNDDEWYEKLSMLVENTQLRNDIASNARKYVLKHCTTKNKIEF